MAEYQFTISQGYSYSRTSFKMHAAFFLYLSKNLMSNVDSLAGSVIDCRGIMGRQLRKRITWAIKNFSSLRSEKLYSDPFVAGGCKWRLCAYPKGNNADYLFLFLDVADYKSLPFGWRRQARYLLNIVNQSSSKRSRQNDAEKWFDAETPRWGRLSMFPLNEIKESGFLVNGELKIVAEIEVLEVIGKLDVAEETSTMTETIDVNGFQLLPSQTPEIASEFHTENPNLRTGYMSLLLSLIETLRQPPHEILTTDLDKAYAALGSLTNAGFKLDWLDKKLVEMSEKKEKEEAGESQMREIEEELKGLKQKCSDLEVQLQKQKKSEVSAAKATISFDDVRKMRSFKLSNHIGNVFGNWICMLWFRFERDRPLFSKMGNGISTMVKLIKKFQNDNAYGDDCVHRDDAHSEDSSDHYEYDDDWSDYYEDYWEWDYDDLKWIRS
ncbi:unnamed protein product [Brassica napus]|uniref:(rape) hypothetical protein n=1 Tax=Brassica napus TaxID=3708 RepID=A0A816QGV1_BRANA|nr:unnamed protein product [Brassica napus]